MLKITLVFCCESVKIQAIYAKLYLSYGLTIILINDII